LKKHNRASADRCIFASFLSVPHHEFQQMNNVNRMLANQQIGEKKQFSHVPSSPNNFKGNW
jgi:hypothetical protein